MALTVGQESLIDGLSTVDLLVLTSLDQLLFIMKMLFTTLQNVPYQTLSKRSTALILPPLLVFFG
jgi:hypothetical protein